MIDMDELELRLKQERYEQERLDEFLQRVQALCNEYMIDIRAERQWFCAEGGPYIELKDAVTGAVLSGEDRPWFGWEAKGGKRGSK